MPKQGSPSGSFRIIFPSPSAGRCAGSTIRSRTPTFGKWQGFELSSANYRQLFVPPGCAHGFCVTSEQASVLYKCTDFYSPKDERGIIWNDPALAISWPVAAPLLSPKDQAYGTLAAMEDLLPIWAIDGLNL